MPDIPRGWRLVAAVFAVCLLAGDCAWHSLGAGTPPKSESPDRDRQCGRRRGLGLDVSRDDELPRARDERPAAGIPGLTGQTRHGGRGDRRSDVHRVEHDHRPPSSKGRGCRHVGHGRLSAPTSSSTTSATNRRRSAALADEPLSLRPRRYIRDSVQARVRPQVQRPVRHGHRRQGVAVDPVECQPAK